MADGEKVVAKFVLPIEKEHLSSGAKVKLGTKAALTINSDGVSLVGKVYNVKRTQVPKTLSEVKAEDLHKFISADGKIYETQAAATRAGATTMARIFYVGNDAETNGTYNHGLALALTDANNGEKADWCSLDFHFWYNKYHCLSQQYHEGSDAIGDMAGIANTDALVNLHGTEVTATTVYYDQPTITKPHNHVAAVAARNFKYADGVEAGAHPEGTSAWFLLSAGQWKKIVDAIVLPEGAYGRQCFTMLREMAGLRGDRTRFTGHLRNMCMIMRIVAALGTTAPMILALFITKVSMEAALRTAMFVQPSHSERLSFAVALKSSLQIKACREVLTSDYL